MRLVILLSGQRPGKFAATYWCPSVVESPKCKDPHFCEVGGLHLQGSPV